MMSISMIWTITPAKEAAGPAVRSCSSPSSRPWISQVALAMQEEAADQHDQVPAGDLLVERS